MKAAKNIFCGINEAEKRKRLNYARWLPEIGCVGRSPCFAIKAMHAFYLIEALQVKIGKLNLSNKVVRLKTISAVMMIERKMFVFFVRKMLTAFFV